MKLPLTSVGCGDIKCNSESGKSNDVFLLCPPAIFRVSPLLMDIMLDTRADCGTGASATVKEDCEGLE